jgi:hypothetical protein
VNVARLVVLRIKVKTNASHAHGAHDA